MYTTSRYASSVTRKAAMKMADAEGEPYIARGKKTIQQLAALARKSGEEFIRVLEEKDDGPDKIAKIKVDALGRWKWVDGVEDEGKDRSEDDAIENENKD